VAGFREPSCTDCFEGLVPGERLDDGVAILAHDAVLAAVWAIRRSTPAPAGEVTPQDAL